MGKTPILYLTCLTCLILSGCGDDDRPTLGPPLPTGSGGGVVTGSTSSSGGGQGGTGAGGEGTAGGSTFGEDGPACFACLEAQIEGACETEFFECFQWSGCHGWFGCTDDCAHGFNGHTCYEGCDTEFVASNNVNQDLKVCGCDVCADVCPSFCTCGYLVEGN